VAGNGEPVQLKGLGVFLVGAAAFSPDGQRLASFGLDGTRVWDLAGRELAKLGAAGKTMVFSPDGTRLATSGSDGAVQVWDWNGGKEPSVLRGDAAAVLDVAFSPDGTRVLSASQDGTVRVWACELACASLDELLARSPRPDR
jgi:WD40 repeat protein